MMEPARVMAPGPGRLQMRGHPRMIDLSEAEGKPNPQECRIAAMDRSPDGKMLIVGGQNMLRLVRLEDGCTLAHGRNVRSMKQKAKHYEVSDLKFHPRDQLVASCSGNSSVVLWQLANLGGGTSDGKLAEHKAKEHGGHSRTVHSLSWHPEEPKQLLTCSQDTTMKLWDLRAGLEKCVLTTFSGRHGAAVPVRSVQFHPGGYPTLFLAGLENGQVQVWDTRRIQEHVCATRGCVCGSSRSNPWLGWENDSDVSLQNAKNKFVKVQAHDRHVFSVQWHPTEKDWFASSGRDGMVHCWDLSKDVRNPVKSIKNMDFKSGVSRVAWRPGYESCLATCGGGLNDYKIHVWDADRPYLPLCFFKAGLPPERAKASAAKANLGGGKVPEVQQEQHDQGHTDDVTGLLWLDENRLASCSKDGTVRIHEVNEGYRPYQGISTVTPAWSSLGDVAVAGAPIVRDWTPKRDHTWLKADRRRIKRAERQEAADRDKSRRSDSAAIGNAARAYGSAEEVASEAKDRDSRGSASDRLRRGIQNVIAGATQSTRDLNAAHSTVRPSAVSNKTVDSMDIAADSGTAASKKRQASKSLGHGTTTGAPPLNPATTAVQLQSLSALGDIGDDGIGRTPTAVYTETSAVAATSTDLAAEDVPEGGWAEQPYNLGYNTKLFEYLAKTYTMTPIFSTSPPSAGATSSPGQLKIHASVGLGVGAATTETESGGNPRSTPNTPSSSPRSTPTAAAATAAAAADSVTTTSEKASAASRAARQHQLSSGGSTPPSSPTRLAASNVDNSNGSHGHGNGNGDVASRRKINLMLARLDRNAARGLGLTTPAAAAAVINGTATGSGTTESERRAQHCLRLGDIAVRDEDELDKAVRWYLAGIVAVKGANSSSGGSSAGAGRTHTPLSASGARSVHVASETKHSVTELLTAQLDNRLTWARRRHCDGVAAGVRHNAAVALRAGQRELANCWQMLQALVTRDSDGDEEENQDANEDEKNENDDIFEKRDSEPTSPIGPIKSGTAASSGGRARQSSGASASVAATDRTGLLDGLFGSSVVQLATWFAERRGEADLQSAVTLLLLVGRPYMWSAADAIVDLWPPHDPSEDFHGAEQTVGPAPPHQSQVWRQSNRAQAEQRGKLQQHQQHQQQPRALTWCHAYIELLQRHRLDTLAIRVAHLSQCGVIQKLNQERAHFKAVAKCLSCDTELPPTPTSAAKEAGSHCNNPTCVISQSLRFGAQGATSDGGLGYVNARCGVCRLPVRGPWVWCQGCGHGGHLACYENWFGHQRLCPTGCNHLCNLVRDELGLTQE